MEENAIILKTLIVTFDDTATEADRQEIMDILVHHIGNYTVQPGFEVVDIPANAEVPDGKK